MQFNEIYDVVDKKGKVIDRATWTEIHSKGLLHKSVHGIVFDDVTKKRTLIKKRSFKMEQESSVLEIAVAGHVLSGYSYDEAIRKEMSEELLNGGILPNKLKILKIRSYLNNDVPNNHEISVLFEIIYPGPFFTSEESEGEAFWIDWEELIYDMKKNPHKYAKFSIKAIEEYLKRTKLKAY